MILFLGGIQLLCLAIIGSYLAHIYDEVKRRPSYIVESTLNLPAVEATYEDEVHSGWPSSSRPSSAGPKPTRGRNG